MQLDDAPAAVDLSAAGAAPRRVSRTRRWLQVFAVAMFINTSYGTMSYAFSVLVTRSAAGGDFGPGMVSLGFGLALLVSGFLGIAVGTVADLFGTRRLMAVGAVVGALGLLLLGAAQEAWQVVLVMMVLIGPATAATFYEPIYVLMNRWFIAAERPRAYGVLTFLSGFSITIFLPFTRFLVDEFGWRRGMIGLASTLLVVGLLVPLLVSEPLEHGEQRAGRMSPRLFFREAWEGLLQADARFWLFSVMMLAATTAFSGFSFHMVAQLETRGFGATDVANVIALTGIVSLPARLLLPMFSGRMASGALLAWCLGLLAVAAFIASQADAWWEVWAYVVIFGAVFGAVYPLRALVVSERFAGPYFGRLIGVQALFITFGRAAGPVAMGAFGTDQHSYAIGFQVAAAVLFLSALTIWFAARRR